MMVGKKRLMIVTLLSFILLITSVSALTYKKGEVLDIKIPYIVNGTIPAVGSYCNITITYPNGTYLKQDINMTYQGHGDYNLTLTADETGVLGTYAWVTRCCEPSNIHCATGYDTFEITPSGFGDINFGQGIVIGISVLFIILLGIILIYSSTKFEKPAGQIISGGLGLVMFLIVILFTLVIFTQTIGGFTDIIEGYSTFWFVMKILFSMSILGLCLFALWFAFNFWQWKRGFID